MPVAGGTGVTDTEVLTSPRVAQPLQIITPEFPKEAGQLDHEIDVEVVGTIKLSGEMAVNRVTTEPGAEAFATAVSDVIRFWRFQPAVDDAECAPIEGAYRAIVSFAGNPADPQISVATPHVEARASDGPRFEWVRQTAPQWPVRVSQRNDAEVRVLMKVTPEGTTKDARVLTGYPAKLFDGRAVLATTVWKVKWIGDPPARPVCTQVRFIFCGYEEHEFSLVGCKPR